MALWGFCGVFTSGFTPNSTGFGGMSPLQRKVDTKKRRRKAQRFSEVAMAFALESTPRTARRSRTNPLGGGPYCSGNSHFESGLLLAYTTRTGTCRHFGIGD